MAADFVETSVSTAAPIDVTARRVLVVDDDANMCELVAASLESRFTIVYKTSASEALEEIAAADFDAVLTDLRMPKMSGIELCGAIRERRPDVPVVVMTAFGSLDTAIAAIRAGAYDFITKPVQMDELGLLLDRVVSHRRLEREVRLLRRAVSATRTFGSLVGESAPMRAVFDMVDRASASDSIVLITGESGTGKGLVARTLHERGPHKDGPFVVVNCAATPESALERELFGGREGGLAAGGRTRSGAFVEANGGTLYLDNVGDLPLSLQAKVLRVLQERRVKLPGSDEEAVVNFRLVASTRRDLESMVEEERFRSDLYYAIHVVHIALPPLRGLGSDKLLLAQTFIEHFANRAGKPVTGLTPEAAQKILDYAFPGNVRELGAAIERAVALTRFDKITVDDLPEKMRAYKPAHVVFLADDPRDIVPLEEVERRYILHVFEAAGHNRSLASQLLGVDRKTLYRKLEKYGAGKGG